MTAPAAPNQPPYPQPKKSNKTVWIILGVVFGGMVLFCGGCLAIVAGLSSGDDGSMSGSADEDSSVSGKKDGDGDGKGQVGNWKILNKPQFGKEFGYFKEVTLKVTNTSDQEDEAWLVIRLTNKAGDLVTTFDCISRTIDPGQTTNLSCTSTDKYVEFSDYEIENAF